MDFARSHGRSCCQEFVPERRANSGSCVLDQESCDYFVSKADHEGGKSPGLLLIQARHLIVMTSSVFGLVAGQRKGEPRIQSHHDAGTLSMPQTAVIYGTTELNVITDYRSRYKEYSRFIYPPYLPSHHQALSWPLMLKQLSSSLQDRYWSL